MRLSEWNEIEDYATQLADELSKETGTNIQCVTYTTCSGSRGIDIRLYDRTGNLFAHEYSGTHETILDYKRFIKHYAEELVKEI